MPEREMNGPHRKLLLILLTACTLSDVLHAANVVWDGGGDGTSWSDAANWAGDALPGGGDHAVITMDGTYTVRLTAEITVAGLTLGGASGVQTLDASGFRLNLGVDASTINTNGVLVIGGVPGGNWIALSIDGPLTVHGRFDWSNGIINANTYYQPPNGRVITIAPDGLMRWIAPGDRNMSATFDNQGTLRWEEGLTYYNQGYSMSSSGLFDIALTADSRFARAGVNSQGPWIFTSTGTVRKTGPGTATVQVELRQIGGTVDVQEDTLLQNYASRWENTTVSVASGATLQLSSNRTFEPHTISGTLTGDPLGTFLVTGIGFGYFTTLTADTGTGGVVNIGGTGLQLDQVSLGGIYDPPTTRYSEAPINRGLMRFVGGHDKSIDGAFVNEGTLRWESGRLIYYVTSSFRNEATFEMMPAADVDFITGGVNGGRPGPFINTGTVLKTGSGTVKSNVDFHTIGGLVDVREDSLIQEHRSRWENATVTVSAGATLQLGGYLLEHVIADTLKGDVQGTFLLSGLVYSYYTRMIADAAMGGRLEIGGTGLQVNYAELGIANGPESPVNGGLFRFVGNDWQFINSDFLNEGTVRWESGNIRTSGGPEFRNAGLFEITAAGGIYYGDLGSSFGTIVNEANATIRKLGLGQTGLRVDVANRGRLTVTAGTLQIESIFNNTNTLTNHDQGIISGTGTLNVNQLAFPPTGRLFNTGTVAPGPGDDGAGIGTLTVVGPFPHNRIEFELTGTDSALYDRLIVRQSSPDLTAVTLFVAINGFTPVSGDFFDVIEGPVTNEVLDVIETPAGIELLDTYPGNGVRLLLDDAEEIELIAPTAAARQGERIDLPFTIISSQRARNAGMTEVTATLRYNVTLLGPIESTPKGRVEANERVIELRLPVSGSGDTTIVPVRFRATLGNDSITALALSDAAANGNNVTVVTQDGAFKLLDLCYEGGARLLNPDGVAIGKVRSDPGSGVISFDIDLIERGRTKIVLTNTRGRPVRTFVDGELPRGRQTMQFNLGDAASGGYFLTVQTPTILLIERVEVVR